MMAESRARPTGSRVAPLRTKSLWVSSSTRRCSSLEREIVTLAEERIDAGEQRLHRA